MYASRFADSSESMVDVGSRSLEVLSGGSLCCLFGASGKVVAAFSFVVLGVFACCPVGGASVSEPALMPCWSDGLLVGFIDSRKASVPHSSTVFMAGWKEDGELALSISVGGVGCVRSVYELDPT